MPLGPRRHAAPAAAIPTAPAADAESLEGALRAADERFRIIFEAAPSGVAVVGLDGRFLLANQALCDLLGYHREELEGLTFQELTHPDDLDADVAQVERVLAGEISHYVMDKRYLHRAGHAVWAQLSVSLARDARGDPLSFISHVLDVSERRAAQEELAAAHARLAEAQEVAGVGSWEFNLQTGDQRISAQLWLILGLEPQPGGMLLEDYAERVPAAERPRVQAALQPLRAGGEEPATFEHRYVRQDGSTVTLMLSARTEHDAEGRPVRVLGTTQDVTRLRAAEAARRRAEARFAAAFELAPIGIGICDLDGAIVQANQALCELTGRSVGALEGSPIAELVHPDDLPEHRERLRALASGELEASSREARLVRPDGEPVWVAVHARLLPAAGDEPERLLVQCQDVTQRRRYERRLQHLADHDPLTGLLNRRAFRDELDRHLGQAGRYGPAGALLVLDLDELKVVNDTLGHGAGDQLIVSVAARLQARLRTTDVLARLGGDEFAILLPRGGAEEAERAAAALLGAIGGIEAMRGSRRRPVTASIGIAVVEHADVTSEELLVRADLAMYEAKGLGRGRFARYSAGDPPPPRAARGVNWLERIEQAIEQESFLLYAQPIRSLRGDPVERYELLIRLRTDDGEVVAPAAFLPLAERFDLIQPIDRWVAGRAVELLRAHTDRGIALNINLSARTLSDRGFLAALERALGGDALDPGRLCLELTETAAVLDLDRAGEFVDRVHELGCHFALDDFGAGFGSLSYLKHLPFDMLKIDGEFVRGAIERPADRLVIEAVVSIARGLGRATVAECAEDEPTLRYLTEAGLDYAQGFVIGVPAPAAAVLAG